MHESLQSLRTLQRYQIPQESTPEYAVPTAADAVVAGTYTVFPARAEHDSGVKPVAGDVSDVVESPAVQEAVQRDIEQLIRGRLLSSRVPRHLTRMAVEEGCLLVEAHGEFAVVLTLESTAPWCDWRVLRVDMLVNSESSSGGGDGGGASNAVHASDGVDTAADAARHPSKAQLVHLGALLQQRMAASSHPLVELCVASPCPTAVCRSPHHHSLTAPCTPVLHGAAGTA